jgi:hypothetical protein
VLQVVSTTYSTQKQIASTSMTDTNLSLSITPSLATSKILVLVTQPAYLNRFSSSEQGHGYRLLRGATEIYTTNTNYTASYLSVFGNSTNINLSTMNNIAYLDSPNTTSSTTYKTQGAAYTTANTGFVTFQEASTQSSMILLEIGA